MSDVLIEAEVLAKQIADHQTLIVIDLSKLNTYQQGHIPTAIWFDASRLMSGQQPIPNKLPSLEQLQTICSDLGIKQQDHIVVYDDKKGMLAGRMLWTLELLGYQNVQVLNGQLQAWNNQNLALEQQTNEASPNQFNAQVNTDYLADINYILDKLNQPDFCIWDARSKAEFTGEKKVNCEKAGHIPGAVNYEWSQALIDNEQDFRLRPKNELLVELEQLGISTDKNIVTHCQTHRRSGFIYLLAKHLGFKSIRCYDGSWFEWGNHPQTPVELN